MSVEDDKRPSEPEMVDPGEFASSSTNEQPIGVPTSAGEDLPPEDSGHGKPVPLEDPNARHRRRIELSKLNFAYWLIGCAILLVVLFAAADRIWVPREGAEPLSTITDLLKLIATTAIGYVFGRSVSGKDE